jgi:hypothetical protein
MSALLLLSHGELTPGRYVCLAVIDNGLDFEEGVARRLLEPFFTTRLEGTGLRLATVHEVVRDHDGAMNVQSKPGHGSRFEAWLPAATVQRCCRSGAARRCSSRANGNGCCETRRCRGRWDTSRWGSSARPMRSRRTGSAPGRFDVILVSHASQSGLDSILRMDFLIVKFEMPQPRLAIGTSDANQTTAFAATL